MKLIRLGVPTFWLVDTISTVLFVTAGGTELEANPLMRWLMEQWGIGAFVALKLAILTYWQVLSDRIPTVTHVFLSAVLFYVACLNIGMLFLL